MFLELLLTLIIHQTVANPFHKYPYVFLLDIGNEELQTNSEQIRISIPGGSLAVRYPAVGEGDSIAHVRLSGIDFGTDLKASIIDGGPGYKYVVIVFMGNPGQAYDAIVTVSTLNEDNDTEVEETSSAQTGVNSSYNVAEDSNEEDCYNSSEVDETKREEDKNKEGNEQLASASNFYDSAENIDVNGQEDEGDEDVHVASDETVTSEDDRKNEQVNNDNLDVQDYAEAVDQDQNQDYDDNNDSNGERYSEVNEERADENRQDIRKINSNLYDKYNALRPHLYSNSKIYPQEINNAQNEVDYDVNENDNSVVYSAADPSELDQMFNDEEVHNDGGKYTDSNNNRAEADESSAVAY